MPAGVGVAQRRDDAAALHLAVELLGHGLPLAGGRLETDVTVARHAPAVHQDGDAALMPLGIEVVECHDVHAFAVEITGSVESEILGLEPVRTEEDGGRGQERGKEGGSLHVTGRRC